LCKRAVAGGGDSIIESIRAVGEVEALKNKEGAVLFGVDADIETRYRRIVERAGVTDGVSFDKFVAQEQRESNLTDPTKGNLRTCIELADYNFKNDWTVAELHGKVEKVLDQISGKSKVVSGGIDRKFSAGILADCQIKARVKTGEIKIVPYDDECVQPASYDLHLDDQFKIFRPHRTEVIDTKDPVKDLMEDADLENRDSFVLHPGSFALGLVKEVTGVDNKHVGRLEGKSSLARLGLIIHTTAGFLDPGNSLQLTLELFNASPLPIKLYPGMKIAQIAFEELQAECEVPYGKERGSSYYGVDHIQESQMHKNFEKFDKETGLYNPEK
jgi:dCTP deaminase